MKKYKNTFWKVSLSLFLLFFSLSIFSQDKGKVISVLREVDSIILQKSIMDKEKELIKVVDKYRKSGDYITTIVVIKHIFDLNEKDIKFHRKFIASLEVYLGQAYNGISLFSESIKVNTQALMYAKREQDSIIVITSSMILSEAYEELGILDKAKQYMLDAYENSKNYHDRVIRKIVLNNVGVMLTNHQEFDEAIKYFDLLEQLEKKSVINESYVNLNKCDCLSLQKKYNEALKYCKLFEKDLHHLKNSHTKASLLIHYAVIFLNTDQLEKAEENAFKALEITNKNHYSEQSIKIYKVLTKIYNKKQDIKKSVFYQDEYLKLNDSITALNMRTAVDNVKLLADIENNKSKIAELKTANELKQFKIRSLVISLIALLFIVTIIFYQRRQTYKAYKKVVKENIKAIETHEEIVSLRKKVIANLKDVVTSDKASVTYKNIDAEKESLSLIPEQNILIETQIRKAFDIDEVFLDKNLDLLKLANKIGTNRVYLSYVFNNIIKQSFNEMLNLYRINHAKKLLLVDFDKYTIEAIALKSGFSNKVTFNRNFKNITGVTPSVFVKISHENNNSFHS